MTLDEPSRRALEIAVTERVFARLRTQMFGIYALTLLLAAVAAWSLVRQNRARSDLASSSISASPLFDGADLEVQHRLDLDEVRVRTRPVRACTTSLPTRDAEAVLARELPRPPEPLEVRRLLEEARSFGVCDRAAVERLLADGVTMAKVDAVYRILLGRPADPLGRFIYGHWLAHGVSVEAVGRDVMTSPEFSSLNQMRGEP